MRCVTHFMVDNMLSRVDHAEYIWGLCEVAHPQTLLFKGFFGYDIAEKKPASLVYKGSGLFGIIL